MLWLYSLSNRWMKCMVHSCNYWRLVKVLSTQCSFIRTLLMETLLIEPTYNVTAICMCNRSNNNDSDFIDAVYVFKLISKYWHTLYRNLFIHLLFTKRCSLPLRSYSAEWLDDREQWTGRHGRICPEPNLKQYPSNCLERQRKPVQNLSQNILCPDCWDSLSWFFVTFSRN